MMTDESRKEFDLWVRTPSNKFTDHKTRHEIEQMWIGWQAARASQSSEAVFIWFEVVKNYDLYNSDERSVMCRLDDTDIPEYRADDNYKETALFTSPPPAPVAISRERLRHILLERLSFLLHDIRYSTANEITDQILSEIGQQWQPIESAPEV